jgi:hypothetical protein
VDLEGEATLDDLLIGWLVFLACFGRYGWDGITSIRCT